MAALASGGVAVHAFDAAFGKGSDQEVFDFLGAGAEKEERVEMTLGADLGDFVPCVAVVTGQKGALIVIGETDLAVVAFGYPAALFTIEYYSHNLTILNIQLFCFFFPFTNYPKVITIG